MSSGRAAVGQTRQISATQGTVAAVSRNEACSFTKPNRDEFVLVAGVGVRGDAHAGATVRHRSRVAADPAQPNLRHVLLIHAELFDELREHGPRVAAGELGENVTTTGLDLLGLPRDTILRFGSPAHTATADGGQVGAQASARQPTDAVAGVVGAAARVTLDAPTADAVAADARTADAVAADARTADAVAADARTADAVAADARTADAVAADARTADAVAAVIAAAARPTAGGAAGDHAAVRGGPDLRPAVVVAGLRNPCRQVNGFRPGLLKHVIGHDQRGNVVRKGGVMGVVLRGGSIRPGDPISVELAPASHLPLDRV
jgi:MOSC domain-containing protein YiiM